MKDDLSTLSEDALKAADGLIADVLKANQRDYSQHRIQIASELYDKGLWNGNWDSSVELEDSELPDLRLIQEDEYDQSMSDDEKPDWNKMICSVPDGYLWEV